MALRQLMAAVAMLAVGLTAQAQAADTKADDSLCARVMQEGPRWQPGSPEEQAVDGLLAAAPTPQARRLLELASIDFMRWQKVFGTPDIFTVPSAVHETNHVVDLQLARCHGMKATYLFNGQVYPTELVMGSLPRYAIAADYVPAAYKARPLSRYAPYFVNAKPASGNDFTVLLDELNAYVSGAQLDLGFAATPLYREAQQATNRMTRDADLGGALDFMLFTLSYLKAVREKDPAAYARLQDSPLFLAHLQRLWSTAEDLLSRVSPYASLNGGLYIVPPDTLAMVYAPSYIEELDRLKIRHRASIALQVPVH